MSDATSTESARDRRWLILGVIGLAELMVVLDVTVMNITLPSAQRALGFTTADRQWVVTAYTLPFGSLLLPGGRLADLFGRKVTFLTGLAGFAGVSAIGGASVNFTMLVTARARPPGPRGPRTGSWRPAWRLAWRSRCGRAGPRTRCCRPGWWPTATGAAPTPRCSSARPGCSGSCCS